MPFAVWCHQESNRGHKDFQSFALPTELWHHLFTESECKGSVLFVNFQEMCIENYRRGFQPCAFSSNSFPSRQTSTFPRLSAVI